MSAPKIGVISFAFSAIDMLPDEISVADAFGDIDNDS